MVDQLTGRIRHRTVELHTGGRSSSKYVLVLQVEYFNTDPDSSPSRTLWRDASSEDLTTMNLSSLTQVRQQ
jgi:hypothetical protein